MPVCSFTRHFGHPHELVLLIVLANDTLGAHEEVAATEARVEAIFTFEVLFAVCAIKLRPLVNDEVLLVWTSLDAFVAFGEPLDLVLAATDPAFVLFLNKDV